MKKQQPRNQVLLKQLFLKSTVLFFAKVHVQIFIFECGLISFGFGRHTGVMNDNLFQAFLKSAFIIVLSKE